MTTSLADSLALVLPDLPRELVPREDHPRLRELAGQLPPVHRCGFEVRLGRGSGSRVDFQQGFEGRRGEPQRLREHLSRSLPTVPGWEGLGDFVAGWCDPSSPLHHGIVDLWLEFDRHAPESLSVFVGFVRAPGPPSDRFLLAWGALDRLVGQRAPAGFKGTLERCFSACREGAYVSHVGLMLGRPAPFLRLNVKRLEPAGLGEYLQRIGWAGEQEEPVELARRLRRRAHVTVCLDVGERVGERVGFECHLDRQPPAEPGWGPLLDELVTSGWSSADKRDALLAWPRLVGPGEVAGDWPPDLLRASLRRPQDHFTCLERQLSHIKVVYEPGRPTEAKGYFGFIHTWLRPPPEPDEPSRNGHARRARGNGVVGAIARAVDFLLDSRTGAGLWRDFSGTVGATEDWSEAFGWSDEWVTLFVGEALTGTRSEHAREASRHAWDALVERRAPLAGWGYNRWAPVDADSTTWGLKLAMALGLARSPAARRARQALDRHGRPDGGIATYLSEECPHPQPASLKPPDGSYAGWWGTSHPCVTAAAASVGGERRREFVRHAQGRDGSWTAYWWEDPEYSTGLAAEALAGTGRADDRSRVHSSIRWAVGRTAPAGPASESPFATAWCIRILCLAGDSAAVRKPLEASIARLLDRQDDDGGWPASARLLAPRPDVMDREASRVPPAASLDEARTFTTATVLSALTRSTL